MQKGLVSNNFFEEILDFIFLKKYLLSCIESNSYFIVILSQVFLIKTRCIGIQVKTAILGAFSNVVCINVYHSVQLFVSDSIFDSFSTKSLLF